MRDKNAPGLANGPAQLEMNPEANGLMPERPCLVVGIGASAGGQSALEQFFTSMPHDCGVAFVVIMHIPPAGPSFLADMLGRHTTMTVVTAEEGMIIQPDTVCVIPAGREIVVHEGLIRLEEPELLRTHHPIDRFFRSLAAELKERAVAVLLSGSGSDGSAGAKAVREAGGAVIVQEPATALYPDMPRSAVAAGAATYILPAETIAEKIAELAASACPIPFSSCRVTSLDEELAAIFSIVKARTGHDFSAYKRSTVVRRIERRMAVNDVAGMKKYLALLETSEQEPHALAQDILIGVTSFFRDPEAFETIRREVIPSLFENRGSDEPVRIWHACCATGEEVYSMAFLIREYLESRKIDARVQIFATDIDETSIAQARAGLYPEEIEAEVGNERLKAFFVRNNNRWQVVKQVREMIVFAHHSVIKNPPFSRLDLLVCRNFLIYLNADMQKRLISLFSQVIKPGGVLFLGSSETAGRTDNFTVLDKQWKIFWRTEGRSHGEPLFPFATPSRYLPGAVRPTRKPEILELGPGAVAERILMHRYSPPCVVVNERYEVVHISTRADGFLEVPVGEPTRDILKMAREELRPALRAAIHKAFNEQRRIDFRGLKTGAGGAATTINLLVEPLESTQGSEKLAMVVFEPAAVPVAVFTPGGAEEARSGDETTREMLVRQLEEQLRITHEQLQATTEQLETSNEGFLSANEELISMNEEFQSANEELQSTNEELETSKEELQSLNEELVTVNAELQEKVEELDLLNSDMENLLASSGIATLFLDRFFTIKRFTPAMAEILNLIPPDIGRPFRHLAGTIDWPGLSVDAATVLEKLVPVEREVAGVESGRAYLMRILPYRGTDGAVDGVVVTLVDITEHKRLEEKTLHLASFPQLNPNPVLEADSSGTITFFNPATKRILEGLGRNEADAGVFLPCDLDGILRDWDRTCETTLYREVVIGNRVFGETIFLTPQFEAVRIYAFDITDRQQAEMVLRRYQLLAGQSRDIILFVRCSDGRILEANVAAANAYGYGHEELLTLTINDLRASGTTALTAAQMAEADESGILFETVHRRRDGSIFPVEVNSQGADINGTRTLLSVIRDITERKQSEEALRESESRVRRKLDSILAPAGDIGNLELADIIDTSSLQSLVDDFYALTGMPMGLLDIKGKVLVGVGWQDVCTKFHRVNPESCRNCLESDTLLSAGVPRGEFKLYKCKNNMWDVSTPVIIGGRHFGNLFMGQFFFEDEPLDYEIFRSQAGQYGFDEEKYIAALQAVPRLSRSSLNTSMSFFMKLAEMISRMSYSNIKLARSLAEREGLNDSLQRSSARMNLLAETAGELLGSDSPQQVVDTLCRKVMEFLDCQAFFNFLVDEKEGRLHLNACAGIPEDEIRKIEWLDYGVAVCGCAARDACPVTVENIPETNDPRAELVKSYGIRAYACHPLMAQGKVLGTISFGTRRRSHFSADDLALMKAVADQVAIAMVRKRSEEELRQAKEEWELTFNSVPDLIAIMDDRHRMVRVNRAMAERLGRNVEECIGLYCHEAIHGSNLPPDFCPHSKALEDGLEHNVEVCEERLGGGFLVSTTPLLDLQGRMAGTVHVARDITERKRAEEDLRRAKEAAESANKTKSLFLANMSHELRTPMTGVLGMLQLVLEEGLPAKQREYLEVVQRSAEALLRILNDILDFSRVEAGMINIVEEPFHLGWCIRSIAELFNHEAQRKGLEFTMEIASGTPELVHGDEGRVRQLLVNLVGNAIKFTEHGRVEVRISARQSHSAAMREFTFAVSDTGIGIPADKKGLLFQSFSQVDASHARRYGGAGLGLAICSKIVAQMGGAIYCSSEEGRGSTFTFTIPLRVTEVSAEAGNLAGMEVRNAESIAVERKTRLLVAEDDSVNREVLQLMLNRHNFATEFAVNGVEAVEKWQGGEYDLILMDVQMPGLDGFAATRAIREREAAGGGHTLIIAITAHTLKEDEARCLDAGMDAYISKPIDFKKCVALINDLLKSGEGARG